MFFNHSAHPHALQAIHMVDMIPISPHPTHIPHANSTIYMTPTANDHHSIDTICMISALLLLSLHCLLRQCFNSRQKKKITPDHIVIEIGDIEMGIKR